MCASDVLSDTLVRQSTVQLGNLARFTGAELEGLGKRQIMTLTTISNNQRSPSFLKTNTQHLTCFVCSSCCMF